MQAQRGYTASNVMATLRVVVVLVGLALAIALYVAITVGNNGMYDAGPGPDPCSGIGVPIGTAMGIPVQRKALRNK